MSFASDLKILYHLALKPVRGKDHAARMESFYSGQADASTYQPATGPVDVVTFSYSLTMIPDWFAAIENALAMLKPGGTLGVVDFYVARKYPSDGLSRH